MIHVKLITEFHVLKSTNRLKKKRTHLFAPDFFTELGIILWKHICGYIDSI